MLDRFMPVDWNKRRRLPETGRAVLIVSQFNFPENKHNMNMYQRVLHGSSHATIHLLVRRDARVCQTIADAAQLHRAPFQNRIFFLSYVIFFTAFRLPAGCRVILTEPSGLAISGWFASVFTRLTWVLDVWDRPRWKTGQHEIAAQPSMTDRLIFWSMRRADLFLLSVLPEAAKDLDPPEEKCVHLPNAIDLSSLPDGPQRPPEPGQSLELAFIRSKFMGTMGLEIVARVAELLLERKIPVCIHLVGRIPDSERLIITRSKARESFRLHGFVDCTWEIYSRVHAGLVPYPDYEDLRYIFPIKVLEHLSQGSPVVATDLPGIRRMVRHQKNGLIVKPGDAEGMADAIETLYADPELFSQLAANALSSIREFDVRAKHETIFRALFEGGDSAESQNRSDRTLSGSALGSAHFEGP